MNTNRRNLVSGAVMTVGCIVVWSVASAHAQRFADVSKTDAPLVVEGTVRQVYRSLQPSRRDYLVQIEVLRSEARQALPAGAKLQFPAPGQLVYVQVPESADGGRAFAPRGQQTAVPTERSRIRAYLTPAGDGGWAGAADGWFEVTSAAQAESQPDDAQGPMAEMPWEQSVASEWGMTAESVRVKGQLALKVTSVERRGAAQQAGLEEGDYIVGVNGQPLTSPAQLAQVARSGKPFSIVVADVRTGRVVQVDINSGPGMGEAAKRAPEGDAARGSRRSLGISAESVRVGFRSALKVTSVEPGSPAANAGLEPGDIIVEANGAAVTGPEELVKAVRKSGSKLDLVVRDTRTGRNTPVPVALGGREPSIEMPIDADLPHPGAGATPLGVVTEMAFFRDELAVKVTEVAAGSPAARAGLQPGMLIIKANDKAVLHPKELDEAARTSSGSVKLQVVDPSTGRGRNVNVALGRSGF